MYRYLSLLFAIFVVCAINNFNYAQTTVCKSLSRESLTQVFTPFDDNGNINPSIIPSYAQYLVKKGVKFVQVGAITTGNAVLKLSEIKTIVRTWINVGKTLGLSIYVQISGLPYPDKIGLAKFCSLNQADGIIVFPELIYKANSSERLAEFVRNIAQAAYPISTFYLDAPSLSGVTISVVRFFPFVANIKNVGGLISDFQTCLRVLASSNLTSCQSLTATRSYTISSALTFGFGTTSPIGAIFPGAVTNMIKAVESNNGTSAVQTQLKLNKVLLEILSILNPNKVDATLFTFAIPLFRFTFKFITKIDIGNAGARYPLVVTKEEIGNLTQILQRLQASGQLAELE